MTKNPNSEIRSWEGVHSEQFNTICDEAGIEHQLSAPYTQWSKWEEIDRS